MKLKDKAQIRLKKELMGDVIECRTKMNQILGELRQMQDLSNISNAVIARLNDLAYKSINKGSLNKMVDKRAIGNQDLYQKLEKETYDIVAKLDIDKIREENAALLAEIGDCVFSCMSAADALEEADCMCIALNVHRPEAAIADASRLVIKEIIPSFITAESFLQSAKFHLQQDSQAHGGFEKGAQGELGVGQGRESITGVLPLFLFKEHWAVAKRRLQPVFGFMCCLDIMGYAYEQLVTIPFLVLQKAMLDVQNDGTEARQRVYEHVEKTCVAVIQQNKTLQQDIIEKVAGFIKPKEGTSTRTSDVVKSVPVLLTQFYCLLKALEPEAVKEL